MFRILCTSLCLAFSSAALGAEYWYPSQDGEATLAYEDMWPAQGDYDFNDIVVGYRMYGEGATAGTLGQFWLYLYPRARGASIASGFAVMMPSDCLGGASVMVKRGFQGEDVVHLDVTSGSYVLIDDTRDVLPGLGFTNTVPEEPVVPAQELAFRFIFSQPVDMGCVFGGVNPFLFRLDRPGQEVHLPGYLPSNGADAGLFGTADDDTFPDEDRYYVTKGQGLPFALDIPDKWLWSTENTPILDAYPGFVTWVTTSGEENRDWWVAQGNVEGFEFTDPEPVLVWDEEQDVLLAEDHVAGDEASEGMVVVPAGIFMQGCNELVDTGCFDNEYPYHAVDVPAFEIDKYQVTVSAYEGCVDAGVCSEPSSAGPLCYFNWGRADRMDHPVNNISWYQAKEYCEWVDKRLCSESEWEMAARGTDGRKYPWGDKEATCEYAAMSDDDWVPGCGLDSTMSVGSKPWGMSPYGAYDMLGNLYEWVEDDYHDSYIGVPIDGSAWVGPHPRTSDRVIRGGYFFLFYYGDLRASARDCYDPDLVDGGIGVRCCKDL